MFEKLLLKTGLRFIQDPILDKHPELLYECPVTKHNIDKVYSLMDKSKRHCDLTIDERHMIDTMDRVLVKSNVTNSSPVLKSTVHTLNSLSSCDATDQTTLTNSQLYASNNPLWALDLPISDIELFFETLYRAKDVLEASGMGEAQKGFYFDQLYDTLNDPDAFRETIMDYQEDINDIDSQLAIHQLHYNLMKEYHIF